MQVKKLLGSSVLYKGGLLLFRLSRKKFGCRAFFSIYPLVVR